MGELVNRVIDDLEKRKRNIEEGNINTILSPFKRFREDFVGIEKAQYITITASTKGSKTQFASFLYIFTPILYSYFNPNKAKVKILYFPLEETPERVAQRFMSYLLFTMSKGKYAISPNDLRSTNNEKPLSQEILDVLRSKEYIDILNYFEECIDFIMETNPTGVYKECVRYAKTVGTVHTKTVQYGKGEDAQEHDVFDYYECNDPLLYNIIFLDHIGLIDCERGMSLKQSMDKMSEYFAKYLRNRYGFTCVAIQQQAFSGEGIDAIKIDKVQPTIAGLGDTKYTSRDSDLVLGLFSPYKFDLPEYMGYNIRVFKDNIRFLSVLVNRNGTMGGVCPLYFDGRVCTFKELPPPTDNAMISIYERLKQRTARVFLTIKKHFKKNE